MNLREMQREILTAIRTGTPSPVLHRNIVNGRGLEPQRCLDIHRQTWLGARMEVLKSAFPVCQQIVGTGCFRQLCKDYALSCPSVNPNLHRFPENFAAWLETWIINRREFADYAYLPDLARFEWARYRVWESGDNETFDFALFARLTPAQQAGVSFRLSQAVSLISSRFPVYELWLLHTKYAAQGTLETGQLPEHLLVYPEKEDAGIEKLNGCATRVYRRLEQGSSLIELQAVADAADIALDVFINHLIELGCITGFVPPRFDPERET